MANSVQLIHRRDELRSSVPMKKKFFASTVKPIWDSVAVECLGQDTLTGIRVENVKTKAKTVVPCSGLCVAIGHAPATALFKGQTGLYYHQDASCNKCGDCADKAYPCTSECTGCQALYLHEEQ
jgi:thioredoxin reductase (NADPH)